MNNIKKDFTIKDNGKVLLKDSYDFGRTSRRRLVMGNFDKDIDKLYNKYNAGLNKDKSLKKLFKSQGITEFSRTDSYINFNMNAVNFIPEMNHITFDNSINDTVISCINTYLNLISKFLISNKEPLKSSEELYSFLTEDGLSIKGIEGEGNIAMNNTLYFSKENDKYYPSYVIQFPISPFIIIKFNVLRYKERYFFGASYYNMVKITSFTFENEKDMLDKVIQLVIDNVYYRKPFKDVDLDLFLKNATEYLKMYNLIKY